jgi:hypothetical protein
MPSHSLLLCMDNTSMYFPPALLCGGSLDNKLLVGCPVFSVSLFYSVPKSPKYHEGTRGVIHDDAQYTMHNIPWHALTFSKLRWVIVEEGTLTDTIGLCNMRPNN